MCSEAPRLGESLRIVDDVLERQVAEVRTGDAFGHSHFLRMRNAGLVDPRYIVLSDRFNHQCVALPMPDGIAEPGFDDLGIMRTPIQEDLTPYMSSAFVNDHQQIL